MRYHRLPINRIQIKGFTTLLASMNCSIVTLTFLRQLALSRLCSKRLLLAVYTVVSNVHLVLVKTAAGDSSSHQIQKSCKKSLLAKVAVRATPT